MSCEYCEYIDDQKVLQCNHAKSCEEDREYYYDEIDPLYCPMCGAPITESEPLMLEQLWQMEGEPVWIEFENFVFKRWAICLGACWRKGTATDWVHFSGGQSLKFEDYGKTWLAYTHKPQAHPAKTGD